MKINNLIKISIFVMIIAIIVLVSVRAYNWNEDKIEITAYSIKENSIEEETIENDFVEEENSSIELISDKNNYELLEDILFTLKIKGNDIYMGGEDSYKTWTIFQKNGSKWKELKTKLTGCEQKTCIDDKIVNFCLDEIECEKKDNDIEIEWDQSYWEKYDDECESDVYVGYREDFVLGSGIYKIRVMYADSEDCMYDQSLEKEFTIE